MLTWRGLGEEELKHLLGVGKVLDVHVSLDGSPYAVYAVFGEEGKGA